MLSKVLVAGFNNQDSIEIIRLFRDQKVYAEIYYDQVNGDDIIGIVSNVDIEDDILNWNKPNLIDKLDNINSDRVFDFIKEHNFKQTWTMENYLEYITQEIKDKVKDDKVLLALSGGVDSSVAATLLTKILGNQLQCMFVDHGLMRKNEVLEIKEEFIDRQGINLLMIDASDRFLSKLEGVSDPEEKRKIIGHEFIDTFVDNIEDGVKYKYLAQGTIYPDVVESLNRDGQFTKSHHNVGGLPEKLGFELLEPMAILFKDEVRDLGFILGLSEEVVLRQPFPGPGIGIRIIGDITRDKIKIVQDSDYILREEVKNANLQYDIWQYFTVLTNIRSVGVTDGERTYDYTLGIRAVRAIDGVTAASYRFPYELLEKISCRITDEVKGVNRVVYDITNKPPSTIEWE